MGADVAPPSGILRERHGDQAMNGRDYFREGRELFNQGRFFESHEVWEEAWRSAHGGERVFYQGLIQVAAALIHFQRGNLSGAASLWTKAVAKLSRFPPDYHGVQIGRLLEELARLFAAPGRAPAPPLPKIVLSSRE